MENDTRTSLMAMLLEAFPQRIVHGTIAPHACEECEALRVGLIGHAWSDVPSAFAEEFCDSLPLLSEDAYNAYLPVWLRAALENPNGEAASMIPINLSHAPRREGFTRAQASALVAVVEFVALNDCFGPDDPVNKESVADVKDAWKCLL